MRKAISSRNRRSSTQILIDSQGTKPTHPIRKKPVYNNAVRPLRRLTYQDVQMKDIRDRGIKVQNPTTDNALLESLEQIKQSNKNLELLQNVHQKGALDIRRTIEQMSGDQLRQLTQFMERTRGMDAVTRQKSLNMAVAKLLGEEYRPPFAPEQPSYNYRHDYDYAAMTKADLQKQLSTLRPPPVVEKEPTLQEQFQQQLLEQIDMLRPTVTRESDTTENEKYTYLLDKAMKEIDEIEDDVGSLFKETRHAAVEYYEKRRGEGQKHIEEVISKLPKNKDILVFNTSFKRETITKKDLLKNLNKDLGMLDTTNSIYIPMSELTNFRKKGVREKFIGGVRYSTMVPAISTVIEEDEEPAVSEFTLPANMSIMEQILQGKMDSAEIAALITAPSTAFTEGFTSYAPSEAYAPSTTYTEGNTAYAPSEVYAGELPVETSPPQERKRPPPANKSVLQVQKK